MKTVQKIRWLNQKTMMECVMKSSPGRIDATHITPLFDYVDRDRVLLLNADLRQEVKICMVQFTLSDIPRLDVEPTVL